MIDLHIHSTCSDGAYSVSAILAEAQRLKLSAISITDHNTIAAYGEIESCNTGYAGKIIRGVEVHCLFNNSKIELLGYEFDDFAVLDDWLAANFSAEWERRFRRSEYERLLARLRELGAKNDCDPVYENQQHLPHTAVYKAMKKHEQNAALMSPEEWADFTVFFRTATTNPQSLFYIDYTDLIPSAREAAGVIRRANGKVFLAHLFQYGLDDHIKFVDELVKAGLIDGVETYYSGFTKEQTETLRVYCENHNLLMSGGSDFHDDNGSRRIGVGNGDLEVPDEIIAPWVKIK